MTLLAIIRSKILESVVDFVVELLILVSAIRNLELVHIELILHIVRALSEMLAHHLL